MKKHLLIFLAMAFMTASCASSSPSEPAVPEGTPEASALPVETSLPEQSPETDQEYISLEAGIAEISKYGNLILTISPDSMRELGYEPADIVLVRIGGSETEMPVGTNYSDADSGEPICCFKTGSDGNEYVILAINGGDLATTLGIAERHTTEASPGYEWTYAEEIGSEPTVYLSMAEKQGFAEEYAMHQLGSTRTNKREDYASLSDEEYANFRVIETTGMGHGTLYRSSSPINPAYSRSTQADQALLNSYIRTILNMADNEEEMKQYSDYFLTNYASRDIIPLNMSVDFFSEAFRDKLAEGFRYMISHEGPYLIHCNEGKDRTGFAAAILECLMGANADEIVKDYMVTYYNFYFIQEGDEQYDRIASGNIETTLKKAFGVSSLENTDLQACAEVYLKGIGMSAEEISSLKENLGKDWGGLN